MPTCRPACCRQGFVALDLAKALGLPLIDPDDGYKAVGDGTHPRGGNGLIGGDKDHPKVVVAANGGSDLVYIPDGDPAIATKVVDALLAQDYVSGLFVHSRFGEIPGTLPLSEIALEGARGDAGAGDRRQLPLVRHDLRRAGALRRDGLRHRPAAGPGHARLVQPRRHLEFHGRSSAPTSAPASSIPPRRAMPTSAARSTALLRLEPRDKGKLAGRVLTEAMPGGALPEVKSFTVVSDPAANGLRTVLDVQAVGDVKYFDAAGFPGRTVGLSMGK